MSDPKDICASCGNTIGTVTDHERWCSRSDNALLLLREEAASWRRVAELEARSSEAVAWMNGASLTIFKVDRERYPGGCGGDLATARYMRSDHHNTPLYLHPPTGDAAGKDSVDAARLDFLIDHGHMKVQGNDKRGWRVWDCSDGLTTAGDGATAREAIDAAIASLTKTADGEKQS